MTTIAQAQLWVGPRTVVIDEAHAYLRAVWCSHGGCGHCIVCTQIVEHRYYALRWLTPKGATYLVEQLEGLLHESSFSLQPNEHFFFIFEMAELLSASSAPRLLKIIEEPPAGYHFLLLTSLQQAILPTISSRCVVRVFADAGAAAAVVSPLYTFLTHPTAADIVAFGKELERSQLSEPESRRLLDDLIVAWQDAMHDALKAHNSLAYKQACQALHITTQALHKPPMPGSGKLFWRTLFLQLVAAISQPSSM